MEKGADIKVQDLMTRNPACCATDDSIRTAAKLMREHDCGALPVVDEQRRPLGVVTDRDIVVRAVADGMSPDDTTVERCMSTELVSVGEDATLKDVQQAMEERKVRRVLVVGKRGEVIGLVPLAKVARQASDEEVGEVLGAISEP